jgi:LmbE family N-acetylglucosaminyl deacetylase
VRTLFAEALRRHLVSRGAELRAEELREPTVVFAPHPDDETLGCGGTIRKRIDSGGHVRVAFMTDGSASHARQFGRAELRKLREHEALRATTELGLRERDVHFLGFPDGQLRQHREAASARVRELVLQERPRAVYVPHRDDGPADHGSTTEVVLRAVRSTDLAVTVFEYPVWLWHSFPWVPLNQGRGLPHGIIAGVRAQRAFLRDLRCFVSLERAHAHKLRALDCYESQMLCPRGVSDYPTLPQIQGGHFLRALLSEYEFFHLYEVGQA